MTEAIVNEPQTERVSWGMPDPRTEAGRLAHLAWHEEDGPKALLTGDPGCGNIGCGLLGTILAVEAEALAAARARIEALRTKSTPKGRFYYSHLVDRAAVLATLAVPSDAPEKP